MNISIIIPVYNEEESIVSTIKEIKNNVKIFNNYEILIVDDCSTDNSVSITKEHDNSIKLIQNKVNKGQSYSIYRGIEESKYENILTIDADGQNNPLDFEKLIRIYKENNCDLVSGIRVNRKDSFIKIISSKIANFVRRKILNDNCSDTGCSLKLFNKKIFLKIPYFNGLHRFIPTFFEGLGYKVMYVNVRHRKRIKGKSKYGTLNRLFNGVYNIIVVKKIIKELKKL